MSEHAPFGYTEDELRSYLPTGWDLAGPLEGDWNAKKRRWTLRVEDTADMPWDVEVDANAVDDEGRLKALQAAMDSLFKGRLGRRTRGLGF
jgi:hypothetical protein